MNKSRNIPVNQSIIDLIKTGYVNPVKNSTEEFDALIFIGSAKIDGIDDTLKMGIHCATVGTSLALKDALVKFFQQAGEEVCELFQEALEEVNPDPTSAHGLAAMLSIPKSHPLVKAMHEMEREEKEMEKQMAINMGGDHPLVASIKARLRNRGI